MKGTPNRNLEEIQRELDQIAVQLVQTQLVRVSVPRGWQPALNAFRCDNHFVICVELAGVDKSAIEVRAEPRRLIIRGTRPIPEPSCDEWPVVQVVLALEIDHGRFERVLELPAEVEPQRVTAEHRNGLLWIKMPMRTQG